MELLLEDLNPDALLADGFEDAFIGWVEGWFEQEQSYVAVYDRAKCIDTLMTRDGMSDDEAEEFFQFNVAGAYVGKFAPMFFTSK
jgi:hypothetical protein